jgi:hypothetical protein
MGSQPPIGDSIRGMIVAVLEIIEAGHGTKGSPPTARVRVVEVLNGVLPAAECAAFFPPRNDAPSYGLLPPGDPALERWKSTPLSTPAVGERIIAASATADPLVVWAHAMRVDSEEERERFRAMLGKTK